MTDTKTTARGAARSPTLRSRATNGKTLFAEGGDMRGLWARRLRDLMELHLGDLGGEEATSEAERSIVRRASVLEVELERLEVQFSEKPADAAALDLYQRTSNSLRRLLESVGLQRRARDITPDLPTYLAMRDSARAVDSAETLTAVGQRGAEGLTSGLPNAIGEPNAD
jgi:hypothetical protein